MVVFSFGSGSRHNHRTTMTAAIHAALSFLLNIPLCWRDSHPLERQLASLHNISGFQAAHPVPLPRSRIPAEPTTPCHRRVGVVDAAPAPLEAKASACRDIGTNAGLQYLLSTLHGDVATAHA